MVDSDTKAIIARANFTTGKKRVKRRIKGIDFPCFSWFLAPYDSRQITRQKRSLASLSKKRFTRTMCYRGSDKK